MLEVLWILGSLLIAAIVTVLAKKMGPEIIIATVAVVVVVANILATKMITIFTFMVPAGVIVYSISFFLTDALSEFYGKSVAYKTVWIGFAANIVFFIAVLVALKWPNAFGPEENAQFESVLGLSARITLAAIVTYLASQFHDVWAFNYWAKKTNGKHLWLRNNASTVISQVIDTTVFITIAFLGVFPILPLIIGQLVVKGIIAIFDTPFLYFVRRFVFKSSVYSNMS